VNSFTLLPCWISLSIFLVQTNLQHHHVTPHQQSTALPSTTGIVCCVPDMCLFY
jgi:hypothetical protein